MKPLFYYCKSIKRAKSTKVMDVVRRIATSLSAGLIIEHLDDAGIVRLFRLYTGWDNNTGFAEMRKKMSLLERIEGIDLDSLVTTEEMRRVFAEIGDVIKYPPEY